MTKVEHISQVVEALDTVFDDAVALDGERKELMADVKDLNDVDTVWNMYTDQLQKDLAPRYGYAMDSLQGTYISEDEALKAAGDYAQTLINNGELGKDRLADLHRLQRLQHIAGHIVRQSVAERTGNAKDDDFRDSMLGFVAAVDPLARLADSEKEPAKQPTEFRLVKSKPSDEPGRVWVSLTDPRTFEAVNNKQEFPGIIAQYYADAAVVSQDVATRIASIKITEQSPPITFDPNDPESIIRFNPDTSVPELYVPNGRLSGFGVLGTRSSRVLEQTAHDPAGQVALAATNANQPSIFETFRPVENDKGQLFINPAQISVGKTV